MRRRKIPPPSNFEFSDRHLVIVSELRRTARLKSDNVVEADVLVERVLRRAIASLRDRPDDPDLLPWLQSLMSESLN